MLNVTDRSRVSDTFFRWLAVLGEVAALLLTGIAVLALLLVAAPLANADEIPGPSERHYSVCENVSGMGSKTRIGGADGPVVTAFHVVDQCHGHWLAAWPEYDIALIQDGVLTECRNAGLLERVRYYGFPDLVETSPGKYAINDDVEIDLGRVLYSDQTVQLYDHTSGITVTQKHVTVGTAINVRGGYSGGGVTAISDDRVVGIAIGGAKPGLAYFIPIEDVCERIQNWQRVKAAREAALAAQMAESQQ